MSGWRSSSRSRSPAGLLPPGPPTLPGLRHPGAGPASAAGSICGRTGEDEAPGGSSRSSGRQNLCWCLQVKLRLCSASETRTEVQKSLQTLHPRFQRLQEPDSYTVTHQHTEEPGPADTISDFICSGRKVSPDEESRGRLLPHIPVLCPSLHQVALSQTLYQLLTEFHRENSKNFLVAN